MPVVKPRVFQLLIVYGKAHRLHKVKLSSRNSAGAGDISGILWYLRFNQHNVKYRSQTLRLYDL